jgi:hypothetical protein
MTVGRPRQGATNSMKEVRGTIARYVGSTCKINYRKVCRKYLTYGGYLLPDVTRDTMTRAVQTRLVRLGLK